MLQHVRVGAIGHYYDVRRLAKLSVSKFMEACRSAWHAQSFADAAAEALKTTGDEDMHDAVAQIATQHIGKLLAIDQFATQLDDFSLRILRRCVEQSENDTHNRWFLSSRIRRHETGLKREKANHRAIKNRTKQVLNNVEACIATLQGRNSCRGSDCSARFQCYIETRSSLEPSFTLRCTRCDRKQ